MNKAFFSLTIALLFFQASALGQSIIYDILLAGQDVGKLKIAPAQTGGNRESLRVEGAINTLFYDVVYVGENIFEKGVLKSSLSSQQVNGRLKEKTNTLYTNDSYNILFVEAKSAPIEKPQILHSINHTVTSLYYREPVNMSRIYSERFGKMCTVQKIAAGAYEVLMPDGKKAVYHYTQGQCREVRSEIVGIPLVFRIRPDSLRQ